MYCTTCGEQFPHAVNYCSSCGTALERPLPKPAQGTTLTLLSALGGLVIGSIGGLFITSGQVRVVERVNSLKMGLVALIVVFALAVTLIVVLKILRVLLWILFYDEEKELRKLEKQGWTRVGKADPSHQRDASQDRS